MSDTPRTDGRAYTHPRIDGELMYVLADFARELERENAALRVQLEDMTNQFFAASQENAALQAKTADTAALRAEAAGREDGDDAGAGA